MDVRELKQKMSEALDFLWSRKRTYQLTFGSPAGQDVLIDLAKFCRADTSTWSEDARHHARLEGRREVWLRIANHLHLEPEQLFALYSGHQYGLVSQEDDNV
jgi:outer membrane protease